MSPRPSDRSIKPVAEAAAAPRLSPREVESLQLAANGLDCTDIAKLWGYKSERGNDSTGAAHVRHTWQRANQKLGAYNKTQAVAIALRRGIIQ